MCIFKSRPFIGDVEYIRIILIFPWLNVVTLYNENDSETLLRNMTVLIQICFIQDNM